MRLKKLLVTALTAVLVVTSLPASSQAASQADTPKAAGTFKDLNQEQITEALGAGWNLGNSLEANSGGFPSETAWGNPTVTEDLFKAIKAAGFKSVRIPVSYLDYITETEDEDGEPVYTIDSKWLARVKEVVDMCTKQGLYAIVNMHGDGYTSIEGGWLFCGMQTIDKDENGNYNGNSHDSLTKSNGMTINRAFIQEGTIEKYTLVSGKVSTEYTATDKKASDGSHIFESATGKKLYVFYFDEIQEKYGQCWEQIATLFKDYDEHLIFESMNEEFNGDYNAYAGGTFKDSYVQHFENINTLNEIFLDSVRQAGGNNDKRWVLIPGWNTEIDATADAGIFEIPEDVFLSESIPEGENRIMVSVHYYQPWDFAGDGASKKTTWGTDAEKQQMRAQLEKVNNAFVKKGYPVVIGEYGAHNRRMDDPANVQAREVYYKTLCTYSKELGCVPVAWDMGIDKEQEVRDGKVESVYTMCLIDRSSYGFRWKNIIDQIMSVYYDASDIPTNITLKESSLSMKTGQEKQLTYTLSPANAVLAADWTTSDDTVAQVSLFGKVKAVGPGTCTLTGSLSNGKKVQCKVTVTQNFLALKLFAMETASWKHLESDTMAEIGPEGGTYTLKVDIPSNYYSKIGSLYLKDYLVFQDQNRKGDDSKMESLTTYLDIEIQSLKLNGTAIPFKAGKNTWHYDDRKVKAGEKKIIDIGIATAWDSAPGVNDSILENLTVRGDYSINFADIPQADTNTFEITFKASNVFIKGVTQKAHPDDPDYIVNGPIFRLDKSSANIGVGESATFSVKNNDGKITASSDKTKIATVTANAAKNTYTVKGKKAGSATITVKDGTYSRTMKVKVKAKPKKITPKKKTVKVKAGKKVSVTLKYKPSSATSYNFTNTNAKTLKKKKISVTASGSKVTVQTNKKTKKGTYTVKLKSYNKKSVSFKVKVK